MAQQEQIQCYSVDAAADLSAKQFTFVKATTSGTVDTITTTGNDALGVLQNKPTSGQAATVAYAGKVKVIAGATVTAGDLIQSDTAGKAITAATSGHFILGRARTGGVAGALIEVFLGSHGVV